MTLKCNGDFISKLMFYILILGCISALKNNGTNYKLIDKDELKRYAELGDSLMQTFSEKVLNFTKNLEIFNDEHIGRSVLGKYYEEWKPSLDNDESTRRSKQGSRPRPRPRPERDGDGRGVKKLGMAMMPLVFHVGASSTWMVITALMSFKAVALMTILLVVKIAVASAKVSAFFTHHYGHKEHVTWASPHHGYDHDVIGHRSFPDLIYSLERRSSPPPSTSSGFQPIYSQPAVEQLDFNPRRGDQYVESKSRTELEDLDEKFSLI